MRYPKFCYNRTGDLDKFDKNRITNAILGAFESADEGNLYIAQRITASIVEKIIQTYPREIPEVEKIQDIVEETLMAYNFKKSAKNYIIYRNLRTQERSA